MTEKTINICGHEVRMRYCAATETGFEQMSGKSIEVFSPTFGKDEEGNTIVKDPPKATSDDYLKLAISSIIAAYSRIEEDPPITGKDILYDATSKDVTKLIRMVVQLRAEWYNVPEVVKPEMEEREDDSPNSQPPTTDFKR